VVCITGDGSIQMNIQELATIAQHKLPIKIFVLNNGGYHSIRQTQDNYFEGRYVGADRKSGVSCPDVKELAAAYGLSAGHAYNREGLAKWISNVLFASGSIVAEVKLTHDYVFDKQDLAEVCHAV